MKKVETDKKNLDKHVKAVLKKLASNKQPESGYKSMDLDELDSFLSKNLEGFRLEKNYADMSMTVSWIENEKPVENTYSVDPVTGEIDED